MTLAAAYGLTPRAVDELTLRDCAVMTIAAEDRQRERVRLAGLLLDGLFNYSWRSMQGGRPLDFGHHARQFLGESAAARVIDPEQRARLRAKALALKAAREQAQA